MRYLKGISKKVLFFVTMVSFVGCGTWHDYHVSKETGRNGNENSREINGVNVYVIPHNRYEVGSAFSPGYAPLVPVEGKGFHSYYYFDELGGYSKPLKGNLDYTAVPLTETKKA